MDTIGDRLKWARRRQGYEKPTDAAKARGWTISTYLGHENGDRNPSRATAQKYAKAFKIRWEWLLEGQGAPALASTTVPVIGYVGAGGLVEFNQDQQALDEAPRPPEATQFTVALIVRGDSMPGVADEGSIVYYEERREGVTDDFIGSICVCWLDDGRTLVKRVYRGREHGRFDLISTAYEPIRDALVTHSAKVTWIKPR